MADAVREARLSRLEDLEEIRLVLLRCAQCLDAGDFAGYAELFAEDGELDRLLGKATGPVVIQELLDRRLGGEEARSRVAVHLISNPIIELDGDRATSQAIWTYVAEGDAGHPIIFQAGRYDDALVREHGRWKFQRHAITRDMGYSPVAGGVPTVTQGRTPDGEQR